MFITRVFYSIFLNSNRFHVKNSFSIDQLQMEFHSKTINNILLQKPGSLKFNGTAPEFTNCNVYILHIAYICFKIYSSITIKLSFLFYISIYYCDQSQSWICVPAQITCNFLWSNSSKFQHLQLIPTVPL